MKHKTDYGEKENSSFPARNQLEAKLLPFVVAALWHSGAPARCRDRCEPSGSEQRNGTAPVGGSASTAKSGEAAAAGMKQRTDGRERCWNGSKR